MTEVYIEAEQRARKSRNRLADHLEFMPLEDEVWKLIADALVDSRIEGYLAGIDIKEHHVEMAAYERGYLEGRQDREVS